jgi:biotin carboxylase
VKGDVVLHKNKPYVIEIATRLSGGWMSSHQIPIATGVDILKIAIKLSLGEKINLSYVKIKQKKATAIRYLFPSENSFFKKKTKRISKNKYVVKFLIYLKNNHIVKKFTDHTTRAGFVITAAQNKKKAILEAKKFIKKI